MLSHVLALNAINLPCRVDNRLPFAPARSDICLDFVRGERLKSESRQRSTSHSVVLGLAERLGEKRARNRWPNHSRIAWRW